MFASLLASLNIVACADTPSATDAAFSRTGAVVAMSGGDGGAAHACFACHGLNGEGDGETAPRLAGLDAGYLHKQLEDYATGLREDAVMQRIAEGLTPAARLAVARHYAALAAPHAPPSARVGRAPPAYQACAACHGAAGEGLGPGAPALAGQPAGYVADQLRRWREARRRNDPRGVMRVAAGQLTDAQSVAIALWLAGQSASRPPGTAVAMHSVSASAAESPAASRAGHRRGPPAGASAPPPHGSGPGGGG